MDTVDLRSLNTATKEYLQAIYELGEELRPIVRVRISERLGIAPASVTQGIRRLATDGLVELSGREIALTDSGRGIAEVLVRRHRLAERMLVDLLGIRWNECHEQAEDWEKVITDEVERTLMDKLSGEPVCPHGNPIPGTRATIPWADLVPITSLQAREQATLVRLVEDLEMDRDVLAYLEKNGLIPPCSVDIDSVAPDRTITLRVGDRLVGLSARLGEHLWVLPASPGQGAHRRPTDQVASYSATLV